jgi:hypothetical protein
MKYLSMPQGNLVTAWVVCRYLSANEGSLESDVIRELRPNWVVDGEATGISASIKISLDLELLNQTEDQIDLPLSLSYALVDDRDWIEDFNQFARHVRVNLVRQSEDVDASDIAIATRWLVGRDWRVPQDPVGRKDNAPQDAVVNTTQEQAFRRWCVELGYARVSKAGGVSPDPTVAIETDLSRVRGKRFNAREFFEYLNQSVPVTDGQISSGETGETSGFSQEILFPSVGFALRRLEFRNVIRMSISDDSPERLIFRPFGPESGFIEFTRVEVLP